MIPTEVIIQAYLTLAQNDLASFLLELEELWHSEGYHAWHLEKPSSCPYRPGRDYTALAQAGLISNEALQARVNKIGSRYFLTDLPDCDSPFAAFPYSDEAEELLAFAYRQKLDAWADTIVDMFAGAGHTPLGMETDAVRYAYDINPRALAFARLNCLINRLPVTKTSVASHDSRQELPLTLLTTAGRRVLFLFNTPFVPNPARHLPEILPISGDGGFAGDEFQIRAFELVAEFRRRRPDIEVKALFLCWTFGRPEPGFWEMREIGEEILRTRMAWHNVEEKTGENWTMEIADAFKALGKSNYLLNTKPEVTAAYQALAEAKAAAGLTHLGYGILTYSSC